MSTEFSTDLTAPRRFVRHAASPQMRLNVSRLVRLRTAFMVTIFLVLAIPGALLLFFLMPVEYQASATLQFLAKTPKILYDDSPRRLSANYEKYVATQVGLIGGPAVLQRTLEQPEIRKISWLADQKDPLDTLRRKLYVVNQRNTELVMVRFSAPERAVAQRILDTIIDQYVLLATGHAKTSGSERLGQLQKMSKETLDEMDRHRNRLTALYKDLGVGVEGLGSGQVSDMVVWHQSLGRATADRSTFEAQVRVLEDMAQDLRDWVGRFQKAPDKPIYAYDIEAMAAADPAVLALQGQLLVSEQNTGVLERLYNAVAPQRLVQQEAHDSLNVRLRETLQNARARALQSIIEKTDIRLHEARNRVEDAKQRESEFQTYISERTQQLVRASKQQIEIEDIQTRLADTQSRLKQIEERIYAIDVESNAPASFQVASRPTVSDEPLAGKRTQYILLAVLGSLLAGVSAGAWREIADQRVRDARDIAALTPLQVLASIPDACEENASIPKDAPVLLLHRPDSMLADEVRRVMTRIVYPPEGAGELRMCMVASPGRQDGRTSVACSLAVALGQANRRVLVVDLCSRAPRVERMFGLDPAEGLGEILIEGADPHPFQRATPCRNVWVIGPGHHGSALVNKLASREVMGLFEQMEQDYDHILLDPPPALLMSETKLLAPVVDGVLMVVAVDRTTLGMAGRCLQGLYEVGANVVGIVLNRVRTPRHIRESRSMEAPVPPRPSQPERDASQQA